MKKVKFITADRLREVLEYDPATGIFRWLVRTSHRIKIGRIAGSPSGNGHWGIMVDKRLYPAHQLVFLYMGCEIPQGMMPDHINNVGQDNRWANLRLATKAQNTANQKKSSRNTSGFKGAYWHTTWQHWYASIRHECHTTHLGIFKSAADAHAAYCEAAKQLKGEFARFK